jgi:hypothetical protein
MATLTIPNAFMAGVVADPAKVNANFSAVETAVNANLAGYTAADVLAKLLTVDGTGTGLDADKLDGNEATAFATAAQGTKADNALPASSQAADSHMLDGQHASEFATSAQGLLAAAALPATSYTAADVLAKVKTVDGASSGLDADTVDGLEASAIAGAYASAATISADGSITFANGLILKWGTAVTTISGHSTYSFPVEFPNACFSAVVTFKGTNYGVALGTCISFTKSAMVIFHNGASSGGYTGGDYYYFAVGN